MTVDDIKAILVPIASTIMVVGLPILLILVYRLHRTRVSALKDFAYPDAEEVVQAERKSYEDLKTSLKEELAKQDAAIGEHFAKIDARLGMLERAKKDLAKLQSLLAVDYEELDSHGSRRGLDLLLLMSFRNNVRQIDAAIPIIDDLTAFEHDLRRVVEAALSSPRRSI